MAAEMGPLGGAIGSSGWVANSESQSNVDEKILNASKKKEEGNVCFKEGRLTAALRCYHYALLYVKGLLNTNDDQKTTIKALNISCWSNMAACYLKLGEWEKCIKVCSDVIGADENNVKAIFRRGKAWLERNNTDRAKEDLLKAIKLAPNDADIRRAYEELRQAMAGEREKQNRVYAKAFANGFGSAEDDTKK